LDRILVWLLLTTDFYSGAAVISITKALHVGALQISPAITEFISVTKSHSAGRVDLSAACLFLAWLNSLTLQIVVIHS
jgi:hypothetical protein